MIVLMPHCGFLSETSRMIAIARALQARGEEVLMASHGGSFAYLVEEAGLPLAVLTPVNDAQRQQRFLDGIVSWGGADLPMYAGDDLHSSVNSEAEFLRDVGARIVVTGFTLSAYVSSRVAGVPLATSHGGAYVRPVLKAGLAPAPVNSPKPELEKLPLRVQRHLANLIPRHLKTQAREINQVAAKLGVEPVAGLMGLMSGDLTMVTDTAEVVGLPPTRLRDRRSRRAGPTSRTSVYRYTGPLYATLDIPVPDPVQQFLDEHPGAVYLSPTSVDESLLRKLAWSVKQVGAPVLIGATSHDVSDLQDGRTMVSGVLPNHLVMPQVSAAVIMGGQGSVQTAMAAGTPFVGLPYHGEQELNIAVAERIGCAVRISPKTAGTPQLTDAVRQVLNTPSFRSAAQRARHRYDRVDGAEGAATAIVDFLSQRAEKFMTVV